MANHYLIIITLMFTRLFENTLPHTNRFLDHTSSKLSSELVCCIRDGLKHTLDDMKRMSVIGRSMSQPIDRVNSLVVVNKHKSMCLPWPKISQQCSSSRAFSTFHPEGHHHPMVRSLYILQVRYQPWLLKNTSIRREQTVDHFQQSIYANAFRKCYFGSNLLKRYSRSKWASF